MVSMAFLTKKGFFVGYSRVGMLSFLFCCAKEKCKARG